MNGNVRPASPVARVGADRTPDLVDPFEDHLVRADVQAVALPAADGLDADLGRPPEVVHGRAPRGVDEVTIFGGQRLGVSADFHAADSAPPRASTLIGSTKYVRTQRLVPTLVRLRRARWIPRRQWPCSREIQRHPTAQSCRLVPQP